MNANLRPVTLREHLRADHDWERIPKAADVERIHAQEHRQMRRRDNEWHAEDDR